MERHTKRVKGAVMRWLDTVRKRDTFAVSCAGGSLQRGIQLERQVGPGNKGLDAAA